MLISFDTNLLPRQGKVKSVAIATLLRVADALNATVAIPSTVLSESINARRHDAQQAIDQHSKAVSNLSKYCAVDSYYVPSLGSIVQEWEEELKRAFAILELDGEDAVEALEREAMRKKPAKSDGTGARDSAIWLCVKREHFRRSGTTHFASNNTDDFAAKKSDHSLHPDLASELGDSVANFHYHTSVDSVLKALCSRVDASVGAESFSGSALLSVIDQVVGHEDLRKFPDFSDRSPEDFGPIESLEFSDIDVRSAYSAAGIVVGFLAASFVMPLAPEVHETLGTSVSGRLGGWFELTADSRVAEFDVSLLRQLAYERPWDVEIPTLEDL
ncbi:PIN domain-containing protein [Streptomyces sp. NPDC096097]|uniref:PIN domain-containing protein n=1 Tax=Streptomyces sp. NPDC096097 TaxID=3155546 RepID=UPI00331FFE41